MIWFIIALIAAFALGVIVGGIAALLYIGGGFTW